MSVSKSKEKLGSHSPALLKASSPPVRSFLRKTMIRTTTKEDDEAQNPMLLEMDPATIYKNAPVTKKDSSSKGNKSVSIYNKIVPKKDKITPGYMDSDFIFHFSIQKTPLIV
uniref:Uncharacterized protein n=1 Tax=Romanomermis culicivorax TaxID=13658 RepID=A0A915KZ32_ROMCU